MLEVFNANHVLSKYILKFDAETFKDHSAIIYPKLVPVVDLLEKFDANLASDLV